MNFVMKKIEKYILGSFVSVLLCFCSSLKADAQVAAVVNDPIHTATSSIGWAMDMENALQMFLDNAEELDVMGIELNTIKVMKSWLNENMGEGSSFMEVKKVLDKIQLWSAMEKNLEYAGQYVSATTKDLLAMTNEGFDPYKINNLVYSLNSVLSGCMDLYKQTVEIIGTDGISKDEKRKEAIGALEACQEIIAKAEIMTKTGIQIMYEEKSIYDFFNWLDGSSSGKGTSYGTTTSGKSLITPLPKGGTLPTAKLSWTGALAGTKSAQAVSSVTSQIFNILAILFGLLGIGCIPFAYIRFVRGDYLAENSFIRIGVGMFIGCIVVVVMKALINF